MPRRFLCQSPALFLGRPMVASALHTTDANTRRARLRPGSGVRYRARRPDATGRPPQCEKIVTDLLYLDSRTRIFKLFFDFGRLFLVDALLDRLRRRLDKILCFLEAKAGDRPDLLDDVDLLFADSGQNHIELGLL